MISPVTEVIALVLASPREAHGVLDAALALEDRGLLVVHDAVIVDRRDSEYDDAALDPTPAAVAVPTALVGALIGVLTVGPLGFLLGGALAGSTAAVVAKLAGGRFTRAELDELRALGSPDRCVLGLLVAERANAAVAELAAVAGSEPVRLRAA